MKNASAMLVVVTIWALTMVLITFFHPWQLVRIVMGVPFLLFIPGFTLVWSLFPEKRGMSVTERLSLSFALSLAVVPVIGLILNYTPWGIRLEPVLYSVAAFTVTTSGIAWLRQRGARVEAEPAPEPRIKIPERGKSVWDQALTVIMAITILGLLWTTFYFVAKPKGDEAFTQFYIIGEDVAPGAPRLLKLGEESSVMLAITNREGSEASYRIQVLVNGNKVAETEPIALPDTGEWQGPVRFSPISPGDDQKVEFLLYKGNVTTPYLGPIYLWINVVKS